MAQSQSLINSRVDLSNTKIIDFSGRQIKNAANAIDQQDYVTLSQVNSLIMASTPKTTTNQTTININGIIKGGKPGAVLFVGSNGQLTQDSVNFAYDLGNLRLNIKNLSISSLTVSKPLKTDASKNLVSSLIVLTTDVSGVLPVPNGGTGQAALTSGSVLVGNGTSPVSLVAGITGAISLTTGNSTIGLTLATASIQYKDWAGNNQTATFVISAGSGLTGTVTFLTSVSLTANAFTNGIRTT